MRQATQRGVEALALAIGLTTVGDFIIIYFSKDRLAPNPKARVFASAFDNFGT